MDLNAFRIEVFTRIFRVVINVDDMIGASSRNYWISDRNITVHQLTWMFGKEAHAEEKSDSTESEGNQEREIVLIGWNINLSTNCVYRWLGGINFVLCELFSWWI